MAATATMMNTYGSSPPLSPMPTAAPGAPLRKRKSTSILQRTRQSVFDTTRSVYRAALRAAFKPEDIAKAKTIYFANHNIPTDDGFSCYAAVLASNLVYNRTTHTLGLRSTVLRDRTTFPTLLMLKDPMVAHRWIVPATAPGAFPSQEAWQSAHAKDSLVLVRVSVQSVARRALVRDNCLLWNLTGVLATEGIGCSIVSTQPTDVEIVGSVIGMLPRE